MLGSVNKGIEKIKGRPSAMFKIFVQLPGLTSFVGIGIVISLYTNVDIGNVPLLIRILCNGGLIYG